MLILSETVSRRIKSLRNNVMYLTTDYHNFNAGKQAETEARVKHSAYTTID